jgi:hypothetical protein
LTAVLENRLAVDRTTGEPTSKCLKNTIKCLKNETNRVNNESSVVINEIKSIGESLNIPLSDIAIWLNKYDPEYILAKMRMAKNDNSITNPTKWIQSALDRDFKKSEAPDSLANTRCNGVPDVDKTRNYIRQQDAIKNDIQQQSTGIIDDGLDSLKKVGL